MGLFGKLVGLAVAVGAGYATVKIAKKYDENNKKEILEGEIDEISKPNTTENLKRAATEVYSETAEKVVTKVKTVAENVGIDTEEFGSAFAKAGDAAVDVGKVVVNASVKVAEKVIKEAPAVIDNAKVMVGSGAEKVKEAVNVAVQKIQVPVERQVEVEEYPADNYDEEVVDISDDMIYSGEPIYDDYIEEEKSPEETSKDYLDDREF